MRERQSNIELLRIVSMFFIVLEHILIMGTGFFSSPIESQLYVANMIIGFTYIGVNCFILITGYFGAEFSWRRLLSLYLICGFYELVGFIVTYVHGDVEWSSSALSYMLFPLSHSNNWFIRCYVILLLLLPVLNAGLYRLDKRQYLYALFALTVLNLYFGWFHKQLNFNGDGYNASQMIYLYAIGRYLGRFVDWEHVRACKMHLFIGWLSCAILWGIVQNIFDCWYEIPHWNGWAYNNPIVLLASIAFFSLFACLQIRPFQSINWIGGTMLGAFLIHMNRYLGGYLYDWVRDVVYHPILAQSVTLQTLMLIALAIGIILISVLFDIPRLLVHRWILDKYDAFSHTHTHTWALELKTIVLSRFECIPLIA